MGNVGKRSTVKEGGHALHGLHQIRLKSILQQSEQGPSDAKLLRKNRLTFGREPYDDAIQPRTQIRQRFR